MKPQKLTEDQIQNTLASAIDDAKSYIESEVAPARIKSQKYANGKVDLGHEEGRSKVVATKCRDTIRAVKPALMRVFLQSDKPVEFIPRSPQSVAAAAQLTNYAKYIFERNNGFSLIHGAFHDALVKKTGVLKVYWDETPDVEIDNITDVTASAVELLRNDPEIDIIAEEVEQEAVVDESGIVISEPVYSLRISRVSENGEIKIDAIAPEDFFVDGEARTIDDCYICGHSTMGRVGDLVDMGFDFEEVYDLGGDDNYGDEEEFTRRGNEDDNESEGDDPSMRKVMITEAYMKMDIEGRGVPVLYKFICAGSKHKILDYEVCDYNPFAVFEVDPEPHTFFGRSLVEIIIDDQDASTSLLRGLLDNIALLNNPGLEVNPEMVNMDDVLNNEIGRVIRVKQPGQVREMVVGSAATAVMPALQYYDEAIRAKTGVSGAGMGLDADALQSQTAAGVNAAVQAATAVSELIARILAEGGMKRLFRLIGQVAAQHPDQNEMMRIDGEFVSVDPVSWRVAMDMAVNVGLGTNKHEERGMVLREALGYQREILAQLGPGNPVVGLANVRATIADILRHHGIYAVEKYFNPFTAEMEKQMMQQAAQAQQNQPPVADPNAAYLQAEQMKVSARVQADMAKTQVDMMKAQMDDDRERDKMVQDLAIKIAEMLNRAPDMNSILAAQNAPRGPMNE